MTQRKKHPNHGGARPGAGAKPKYGSLGRAVPTAISLPVAIRTMLDKVRKRRGESRSEFIIRKIREENEE